MRNLAIVVIAALTLMSCQSKEDIAYEVIQESNIYPSLKAKEVKKIMVNEDHFYLNIYEPMLRKYIETNEGVEYGFSRYIFRTDRGIYVMYYIIDTTNKKIILKTGNFDKVFKPFFEEFMPTSVDFIKGKHTLQWI